MGLIMPLELGRLRIFLRENT
uniref:Cl1856_1 n=1 Tax=Arundo donax TaxID=35708 RepID=A0A0A8ZU43_ARUDO